MIQIADRETRSRWIGTQSKWSIRVAQIAASQKLTAGRWHNNIRRHGTSRPQFVRNNAASTGIDQSRAWTVSGEHAVFAASMVDFRMGHAAYDRQLVSDFGGLLHV